MSDDLRILLSSDLNEGKSIKNMNATIRRLEKHESLKAIRLKVDVDQNILKTLKEFNRNITSVNQSILQQSKIAEKSANTNKKSTNLINQETQALKNQSAELEKNNKLKTKVKTSTNTIGGEDIKTDTTVGDQFRTRTTSETVGYDSQGTEISRLPHPIVETFDHAKLNEAEKSLSKFTENSNARLKELRKSLGNLNPEIVRLSKDIKGLDVTSSKTDISKIDDQIKNLETFSKQEIKAREQVDQALSNIGKKTSQREIDDINKRAELSQKARLKEYEDRVKLLDQQAKIEKGYTQEVDRAEFDAYKEKERREANIHGKRIQDQQRAYNEAVVEDGKFNKSRMDNLHRLAIAENKLFNERVANEKKFARMQQDTLNKIAVARQKFGQHKSVRAELDSLEADIRNTDKLNAKTKDWDNTLKQANTQITKSTAGLKAMRQESISIGEALKTAFQKFPVWMIATTAFYAPLQGMQAAVDTILQVDKQITELKRVMDEGTNFDNLLQGSIDIATKLGRSIVDVNDSLVGFSRQGFGESEILALTEAATLATNISELKADEAMDALTAAMTVFGIESNKSLSIVDKINEIDNNFAVTSKNLAIGMQKSASAADTFGVSIDELLGDLTGIMQVTRESGAIAGNSLKTIYSRLTTMQPAIDALASIGVNIHGADGELKTATQIIDETAIALQGVNEETKQNVAVTVAGRYQLSRFLALVNNRNIAHEATAYALNSENSAMRENAAYMESFEARINKLKASWQQFSLTMGEAVINDSIIAITNSLTSLASIFGGVVNSVGLLPPVLGVVSVAIALMSTRFKTAAVSALTFNKGMSATAKTAQVARISMIGLANSLRTVAAATVFGAAFVALGFVLDGLISKWAEHTEAVKVNSEEQEKSIESLRMNGTEVKKLLNEYNYLSEKTGLSASENERLLSVQNQLNELMPSLTHYIDEQGQAHLRNADNIKVELEHLNKLQKMQDEVRNRDKNKNRDNIFKDIDKQKEELSDLEYQLRLAKSPLTISSQKKEDGISFDIEDKNYQIEQSYQAISNSIYQNVEASLRLKYANDSLTKEDKKYLVGLADKESATIKEIKNSKERAIAYDSVNRSIESQAIKISELRSQLGTAGSSISVSELLSLDSNQLTTLDAINKKVSEGTVDWKVFREIIQDSGISLDTTNKIVNSYTNAALRAGAATESAEESMEGLNDEAQDLSPVFEDATKNVKSLNQILYDLSDGQSLSAEQVAELILKYPQLATEVTKVGDAYKINASALQEIRKEEIKVAIDRLEDQKRLTQSIIDETTTRMNTYQKEVQAMDALNKSKEITDMLGRPVFKEPVITQGAYGTIDKLLGTKNNTDDTSKLIDEKLNAAKETLKNEESSLKSTVDQIEALKKIINDPNFGVSSSKSGSSSKDKNKDEAKLQDLTDARINALNAIADAQSKLNDVLEQSISSDDTYSVQISKTKELLNGTTKEISYLTDANKLLLAEQSKLQSSNKGYTLSTWLDSNGEASESFIKLYNSMKSGTAQDNLQALFDKYSKFSSAIKENETSISSLIQKNKELKKSEDELKLAYTQNYLDSRSKELGKLDEEYKKSQQRQSIMEEDGENWRKEQEKQVTTLYKKKYALTAENNWIRERLAQNEKAQASEKLTTAQLELLNEQLKANSDAWYDTVVAINSATKAMEDNRKEYADKIIADYKKMLEQQRDLELDAIEERENAEDDRHDNVMDNYRKELDAFKKIIDAQKKALNRENDSEDYNRELNKLLGEESEIQNKINTISNVNSYEGKAKRKELEKQLADIQEQIEEKQRERGRKLQSDALDDLLEDREKHIGDLEDTEDEHHKNEKKLLEQIKNATDLHWKSRLEDEQMFYNIKQNLLSSDTAIVQSQLQTLRGDYESFFNYLQTRAQSLGTMFSTINGNTKTDYDYLDGMPNPTNLDPKNTEKAKAWKEYLQNKKRAEEIKTPTNSEFQQLRARNDELRAKYGFIDGSYNQLKDVDVYHNGGEVGVKGTTTQKWWDKVLKSNEVPAILKKKEVVLDNPMGFINDMANRMMSNISNIAPKSSPASVVSSGTTIENIHITMGNVKDGSDFADKFIGGLSRKGVRIGR